MATDEPPPFFISPSQEEKLRTSKYQGQVDSDSDDSLDISVSSTPESGGNGGATTADGIQTGEGCNRCSETVPTLPPVESMEILKGYVAINAPSGSGEERTCFASSSSADVGEAVKASGGAAYPRVGETVVKAGGGVSDGRKARGIKRSLKQDLLAMVTQTMRVSGQYQRKSGAQRVGILETAKRMGVKFPKPEHWPPGKEL